MDSKRFLATLCSNLTAKKPNREVYKAAEKKWADTLSNELSSGKRGIRQLIDLWRTYERTKNRAAKTPDGPVVSPSVLLGELVRYEEILYREIAFESDDNGILLTPELITVRGERIKQEILQIIRDDPKLTSEQKQATAAAVKRLQILTLHSIQQMPDSDERSIAFEVFEAGCGLNLRSGGLMHGLSGTRSRGLVLNLAAIPPPAPRSLNTNFSFVTVCPEGLVSAVKGNRRYLRLEWSLAHEIGHAISRDISEDQDIARSNLLLPVASQKLYASYLACLGERYKSAIPSLSELSTQLVSDPLSADLQAWAIEETIDAVNASIAYTPSGIESHSRELVADLWANRWAASHVATSSSELLNQLANRMSLFCRLEAKSTTRFPLGEDGQHPSDIIRVELFLSQPEVRSALKKSGVVLRTWNSPCGL